MLKNTFCHIPGVGKETEANIWRNNTLNWEEFLTKNQNHNLNNHIEQSLNAYRNKDYKYFIDNIPGKDHWRTYPDFKEQCCFLDIETTGLDKHRDDITLIGLYNGTESKIFTQGENIKDFALELDKYPLVVTFNGRCFDIPFIRRKYPEVNLNKFHIDLRFAMKNLGYSGGLKKIEKQLGINRGEELDGVDGFEAVRLWYSYKKGNDDSLTLLKKYLKADIENLKTIMDFAFDKLKEKEFLSVID
jgi:uncharacterized protein